MEVEITTSVTSPRLTRLRRWYRWVGVLTLIAIPAWTVAWWFMGIRVWATHTLDLGAAFFVSVIWAPLMVLNMAVGWRLVRAEADALRVGAEKLGEHIGGMMQAIRDEYETRTGLPWPGDDDEAPPAVH